LSNSFHEKPSKYFISHVRAVGVVVKLSVKD